MAVQKISLKEFLRHIRDQHVLQPEKPFCFVLGAGASKESEIPTGLELIDRWLPEIQREVGGDGQDIAKWATVTSLDIPGFVYARRDEFYGEVYARRFRNKESIGQSYIEPLLLGKDPSIGYSVLAWLMATKQHRIAITTNFDNLTSDALFLYGNTAPILCAHESLAGYAKPHLHRPLVVKLHRDLSTSPRNSRGHTAKLDTAWQEPLQSILSWFTPIFLGYGGNDGSLMGFLENLPSHTPDTAYWTALSGKQPNKRVMGFLERRNGFLVEIPGFDAFMMQLGRELEAPDLFADLESRHQARADKYKKQLAALNITSQQEAEKPGATEEQKAVATAVAQTVEKAASEDTPQSWILRAQAEGDKGKAEVIYRKGRAKHPESGDLMVAFADFLANKRQQFDEAENLLKEALAKAPDDPARLHDYGSFLWFSRSDGRRAEPLLRKAVAKRTELLGPEHPDTLSSRNSLAEALDVQGKHEEAEKENWAVLAISERVLGAEHPDALSSRNNLATALQALGKHAEAEKEHRAVLTIREQVQGAEHPDTLASRNNLANALAAQGKYEESEKEHRAVLAIRERVLGPGHPDTLRSRCNLANDLDDQGKYAKAEKEYLNVLTSREHVLGAKHQDVFESCYNLALCLAKQGKLKEALEFAQRAEEGWKQVLDEEHSDYKQSKSLLQQIEAELKAKEAARGGK